MRARRLFHLLQQSFAGYKRVESTQGFSWRKWISTFETHSKGFFLRAPLEHVAWSLHLSFICIPQSALQNVRPLVCESNVKAKFVKAWGFWSPFGRWAPQNLRHACARENSEGKISKSWQISRRCSQVVSSLASGPRAGSLPWFGPPLVQGASRLRRTDEAQKRVGDTFRKALATRKHEKLANSERFCKVVSPKFAPRLRGTAISKSKSWKDRRFGALFEVELRKIAPRLRSRAIWKLKSLRNDGVGTFLEVQNVFRVAEGSGHVAKCVAGVGIREGWKNFPILAASMLDSRDVLQCRRETWEILAGRNCAKCCFFYSFAASAKAGPKSEVVRRVGCRRCRQNLHHACARERFGSQNR